jgi:uncharacterized protein
LPDNAMLIGVLKVKLAIRQARSLKDRRQALQGLKERLRNRFNVSVAEIGDRNLRQSASLGICAVGMERAFLDSVLSQAVNLISSCPFVEMVDYEIEFI